MSNKDSTQKGYQRLHEIAPALLLPLPPNDLYRAVVEEAKGLTSADDGSLFLTKDNKPLRVYASSEELYTITPRTHGLTHKGFIRDKPFTSNVPTAHPLLLKMGYKTIISLPLRLEGKSFGLLTLLSKKEARLTQEEQELLAFFAELTSIGIHNAHLFYSMKKSIETRDYFISLASHELKTPLTAINVYIQLIDKKRTAGKTPDDKWYRLLSQEVTRLTHLVQELLSKEHAKTGELSIDWKECSLSEIIQRAIETVNDSYPDANIQYKNTLKENSDLIVGDYDKLLQVFLNLLTNAIKFSPKHQPITATLSSHDKFFLITFEDHGIGIAEKDLNTIFKQFYQVDPAQAGGMGLGLFLAKNIITLHQGSISVTSKLGKGATFTVTLPRVEK